MLYPRFVCCTSHWLQNMSIPTWSVRGKVVNFGCIFFCFSLHHLFMHTNLLGHALRYFGSVRFAVLRMVIFWALVVLQHRWGGSLVGGRGCGSDSRPLQLHHECRNESGPKFEWSNTLFTAIWLNITYFCSKVYSSLGYSHPFSSGGGCNPCAGGARCNPFP